jgi:NADP-dependent aldehyde dehydrogenase
MGTDQKSRTKLARPAARTVDIAPNPLATPASRAGILTALADALDQEATSLLTLAARQTRLSVDELRPEFARATGTMRLFATTITSHPWNTPLIDRGRSASGSSNARLPWLQRIDVPLGPVAVFGASNFPFAYGVLGGDTASALAAGCPVIVKEHPAHRRLGRALYALATRTLTSMHGRASAKAILAYVEHTDPHDLAPARTLLQDSRIAAVGFTGSHAGGLAVASACAARAVPIPAYCEMGAPNPVLISRAALAQRAEHLAEDLAASILLRHGQQCTRPGLIILDAEGPRGHAFVMRLSELLAAAPARAMLAPWIAEAFRRRVDALEAHRRVEFRAGSTHHSAGSTTAPVLFAAEAEAFDQRRRRIDPVLSSEVFGPCAILIPAHEAQMPHLLPPAALTCTLIGHTTFARDRAFYQSLLPLATQMAGRVIINGVPTGVRPSAAMVHTGPFPATNCPQWTAVGPEAIRRWLRPVCIQHADGRVANLLTAS